MMERLESCSGRALQVSSLFKRRGRCQRRCASRLTFARDVPRVDRRVLPRLDNVLDRVRQDDDGDLTRRLVEDQGKAGARAKGFVNVFQTVLSGPRKRETQLVLGEERVCRVRGVRVVKDGVLCASKTRSAGCRLVLREEEGARLVRVVDDLRRALSEHLRRLTCIAAEPAVSTHVPRPGKPNPSARRERAD